MSLRDDLIPVIDELRGLPNDFGLRRFSVVLRRRVWSGKNGEQPEAKEERVLSQRRLAFVIFQRRLS